MSQETDWFEEPLEPFEADMPSRPVHPQLRAAIAGQGFAEASSPFVSRGFREGKDDYALREVGEKDWLRAVVTGEIPMSLMEQRLSDHGVRMEDLVQHGLFPAARLEKRRLGGDLTPGETRRLARIRRVVERGVVSFGDVEHLYGFLAEPWEDYGGISGFDLLKSEEGAAVLMERFDVIDHGMIG